MDDNMNKRLSWFLVQLLAIGALLLAPGAGPAGAQPAGANLRGRAGQRQQGLPPAEVERLFDGYVAMQAQDALKLTDAQFPQFLAKLKVLQETRRRYLQERRQLVGSLGLLLRTPSFKEAEARETLKKIRDLDSRSTEEIRKAYDNVDQVLDVSQQARFRVFEQAVELRKFDLVARARRNVRDRGLDRQRNPQDDREDR